MTGFTRTFAKVTDDVILAEDFNDEFQALEDAFSNTTGHVHDGSVANGAYVPLISDADNSNAIQIDSTNNEIEFYTEVATVKTAQMILQDGKLLPAVDNDIDLGSASFEFKDLYIDGTANIDSLVADSADINGGTIDNVVIGGTTPAAGTFTTFTSTGIDDNATGEVLQLQDTVIRMGNGSSVLGLYQAVDTEQFIISGGTASSLGGTIYLYGGTHATGAGDIAFNSNGVNKLLFDASDNRWEYQDTAIYTTGALTCGTFTSTGIDDNATGERLQISDDNAQWGDGSASEIYSQHLRTTTDGQLTFWGGNAFGSGGSIQLYGIGDVRFGSGGNTFLLLDESAGSLTLSTGTGAKSTALTLDSSQNATFTGNVGIGTSSPIAVRSTNLSVSGSASAGIYLEDTGYESTGNGLFEIAYDNGDLIYRTGSRSGSGITGGVERMRIDSSGNVGIGTSSPVAKQHIAGAASSTTELLRLQSNTNSSEGDKVRLAFSSQVALDGTQRINAAIDTLTTGVTGSHHGQLAFSTMTLGTLAERMRIDSTGNVGIGTSSPTLTDFSSTATGVHIKGSSQYGTLKLESNDNKITWLATGTDATYFYVKDANPLAFGTNNTERMRIDSSGNLCIGVTSAYSGYKLSTYGWGKFRHPSADSQVAIVSGSTTAVSVLAFGDTASDQAGVIAYYHANDSMRFNTVASERMRIDSSGDVLVGLTTPTGTPTYGGVYIAGDRSVGSPNSYAQLFINHSSSTNHGLVIKELVSSGGNAVIFLNSSGTTIGSISTTSSATAYNTSSDYRLKEDWQPMTDATTRLMSLNPVNFAWKADGSRVDGFIAHEAQVVVPEAVTGEKDAVDDEGNPKYQGIDQSKLVPLLTKALQEAMERIETLEAKVAALESV